jgi:arginyl-tRNA synthetase
VLCDDGAVRAARLLLVDAVRHVIRSGLDLLGIAAPERM